MPALNFETFKIKMFHLQQASKIVMVKTKPRLF